MDSTGAAVSGIGGGGSVGLMSVAAGGTADVVSGEFVPVGGGGKKML